MKNRFKIQYHKYLSAVLLLKRNVKCIKKVEEEWSWMLFSVTLHSQNFLKQK